MRLVANRHELAALRRSVDVATEQLKGGRRAAGDRLLRQVVGALARRGDWSAAARGQLSLVASLLRRGRARAAEEALAEAQGYVARSGESLPVVALLSGVIRTDLAELDAARAVLRAAVATARDAGDAEATVASTLALSRCLFWRGDYKEAGEVLAAIDSQAVSRAAGVCLAIAVSRVAVGLEAHAEAAAKAAEALASAHGLGEPSLIGQAACAAAFACLAAGDGPALTEHALLAIQAARAAHEPLCALRARLIAAEHARRQGKGAAVTALLGRIRRLPVSSLPATVRARCALLGALLSSSSPEAVRRQIAATGLRALALFAPAALLERGGFQPALDRAAGIIECCQGAEDEEVVLGEVCRRLRSALRAVAIAFFSPEGAPVARDGGRGEVAPVEFVRRIVAARHGVPPSPDGRMEGGVPVRHAGEVIGALIGRWGRWPQASAGSLDVASMTLAATAAAPALAAVLARQQQRQAAGADEIAGLGTALNDIRRLIDRAASAPFTVLIEGESGSGKELVARALHQRSPRKGKSFCTLNCAALPDDLVEAELFGHARGAFTGAVTERRGVFEEAHAGTLFLDEVGELSPRAQAKLLRVIQEGELRRLGENVARRIDVRIVAATNRDLKQEVDGGRFRLDLLYRLGVIRITVPPLRDRRQDVALLAGRFWQDATGRLGSRAALSAATLAALARYDWPGNVRELQSVVADLAVRSPGRGLVPPTALPPAFQDSRHAPFQRLAEARRIFDEQIVRAALLRCGGRRSRAARELGITRPGLTKLMTRLGISEE